MRTLSIPIYVWFLLFITLMSYIIDLWTHVSQYQSCVRTVSFHSLLLLHHFLWWYVVTGWLVLKNENALVVYLVIAGSVMVNWAQHEGDCGWTRRLNQMCGLPKRAPFRDLVSIMTGTENTKTTEAGERFYQWFLRFVILVAVVKLFIKKSCVFATRT